VIAQAAPSIAGMPKAVRWSLLIASCVAGQGFAYFIFLLAKNGGLDHLSWLFGIFGGLLGVMAIPGILFPALVWHFLQMGSRKVPVSLLQGVAVGLLATLAGIAAQIILVTLAHLLSGFA